MPAQSVGFVSSPRLVQRDKNFLVNVFQLVRVSHSLTQKPHHSRTYTVEQGATGIAIAFLHGFIRSARNLLHSARPVPSVLFISPGGTESYTATTRSSFWEHRL